jgi:uncharacterized protein
MTSNEKRALLEIARRALVRAVEGAPELDNVPDNFPPDNSLEDAPSGFQARAPGVAAKSSGAFVTLRTRGRLRGCIGQTQSDLALPDIVAHCTRAAALEDPRFSPMRADELGATDIEISVLSEPKDIAPESIRVGEHGLIVSQGRLRGVLLPHVATEFNWPAMRFLEETCVKAGLNRDAWRNPETRIQGFTAEVFGEKELASVGERSVRK